MFQIPYSPSEISSIYRWETELRSLNSLAINSIQSMAPEEWFRWPDTEYLLWADSWRNPPTVLGSTHCVNQGQGLIHQDVLCYFIHPRVSETCSNMMQHLHIFGTAAGDQMGTSGTSQMVLHTSVWAAELRSYHGIIEHFELKGTLKGHLVSIPLPWAGSPSTRPGCSKSFKGFLTWPLTLSRMEHTLLWEICPRASPLSVWISF